MKKNIKNIALGFSILVLFFFALSYYSKMVYDAAINGRDSGFIAGHLTNFANYPNQIKEVLTSNELAGIPSTYLKMDSSFQEVNHLNYDLFAVNSFWNIETNGWDIKLFNLKNDSVIHKWTLADKGLDFVTTDWSFANAVLHNCIILPDQSIIVSADESANLMRLDAQSKPLWINHELIFHHSLNLDADSNLWTCSADLFKDKRLKVKGASIPDGKIYKYKENYITKIDQNTGKILFHKGISQIFTENHYKNFMFGFGDEYNSNKIHDPIHLNDVQPLLKDGKYWKKGDLLLSMRHRSLVMLYRPSTNKIIRLIYGDFTNQHDVDIVSDSEISIFNNNTIRFKENKANHICKVTDSLLSSEIVIYNFQDSTCKPILTKYFIENKIWTETQGLHQRLSNGDLFVESQNSGKLYLMNNSGVIMKKQLHTPLEGYAYHTNWIRLYEQLPY